MVNWPKGRTIMEFLSCKPSHIFRQMENADAYTINYSTSECDLITDCGYAAHALQFVPCGEASRAYPSRIFSSIFQKRQRRGVDSTAVVLLRQVG